ncbi:hypothetical protein K501DRAFT_287070 [Backusella circina FSU 941]|nr:hypothetical protein K501DRAFT_287070 [Backusella circina FSU 941]
MSDSEEEDYMSLKFLEGAEQFEKERKPATYSEKRKQQIRQQQKKAHIKPRAVLEQEERERGLETSVSSDNKGLKMLMKMGFKQGTGLGKDGITQPIKVELKAGRHGIGMDNHLKREREEQEKEELELRKRLQVDPDDYRATMAQKAKENQMSRYLKAAVSICQNLDQENKVESNILWLLKPQEEEKEEESKDAETENEPSCKLQFPIEEIEELKNLKIEEQLIKLLDYLRTHYYYCFWCSVKYSDQEDLDGSCPGPNEDDH